MSEKKIQKYEKEIRQYEPWKWQNMMQLASKVTELLFKNVSPCFSYAECNIVLDLVKESIQKVQSPAYAPEAVEIQRNFLEVDQHLLEKK